MMRIRGSRRCSLPALATFLLLLPCVVPPLAYGQQAPTPPGAKGEPQFALRGQREARAIKYGDWQKVCFKTPGSAKVCRTTISGTWETGQSAVRIDLIEREGETTARLQLFLPVGLYLQVPVKFSVDQGEPINIPYVWCLTNTCIAGDRVGSTLIHQLENGKQLQLEVADTSLLSVRATIPLDRFASAHASAPSRTFEQDIDE